MERNAGLSALDILKHTPRTNCGKCGVSTCMGFSALVARGQKNPRDCPYLNEEIIRRTAQTSESETSRENRAEQLVRELKGKVKDIDFSEAAERLDGELKDGGIMIRCLGKPFVLDRDGELHTMCHVNHWIHVSLLQYVLFGAGEGPVEKWTTFKELKGARDWAHFYAHRCEREFHRMADEHTDLFLDILDIFGREHRAAYPSAPHSYLLHPLPKVPFLFCHWPPEGNFGSEFRLFFDRTIESNLEARGAYLLSQGVVEMFRRIIVKHTVGINT